MAQLHIHYEGLLRTTQSASMIFLSSSFTFSRLPLTTESTVQRLTTCAEAMGPDGPFHLDWADALYPEPKSIWSPSDVYFRKEQRQRDRHISMQSFKCARAPECFRAGALLVTINPRLGALSWADLWQSWIHRALMIYSTIFTRPSGGGCPSSKQLSYIWRWCILKNAFKKHNVSTKMWICKYGERALMQKNKNIIWCFCLKACSFRQQWDDWYYATEQTANLTNNFSNTLIHVTLVKMCLAKVLWSTTYSLQLSTSWMQFKQNNQIQIFGSLPWQIIALLLLPVNFSFV